LSCVNWTCEGLKHSNKSIKSKLRLACELNLWGIETFLPRWRKNCSDNVWIEPVRDWNCFFVCLADGGVAVWIEPVRDWNREKAVRHLRALYGVNWTCEGLKQFQVKLKWYSPPSVNWTCEGLKHIWAWWCHTQDLVWIEPVRDWNKEDDEGDEPWPGCELNLWGIETRELEFH